MTLPTSLLDWATSIVAILTILGAIVGVFRAIYKWGFNSALKTIRRDNLRNGYENLYAPMYGLFITKHFTLYNGVHAPYFIQRWHFAKQQLRHWNLIGAVFALFDKKKTKISAEFEDGDFFPLSEIKEIIKGKEAFADERLLNMIGMADLSYYTDDSMDEAVLRDEELELYFYIEKRYRALHRIFGPK